jgi:ectoine hydroxylase-related dioxygenase (phytanoyl-CoA dioxygenase family)
MSTYPLGGLIAIWIALEDVGPDQGPLHYYPGSHRLPYYRNEDYGNGGTAWRLGNKGYAAYEAFIAERISEAGFPKETFLAKKGDVLIWHANLFHGGNAHLDFSQTRKSMVMHYFARNAVCYHELTQRPALMAW